MAKTFEEYQRIKDKADREGNTMSDQGYRGGVVTVAKKQRQKKFQEDFQHLQAAGRDWWNK